MDKLVAEILIKWKDDPQFKENWTKKGPAIALEIANLQVTSEKLQEIEELLNNNKKHGTDEPLPSKINK